MGAPVGNTNATKGKPAADALRRALARAGEGDMAASLNRIMGKLVDAGDAGEQWAIREIADRLDGKPAQAIIGDSSQDPVQLEHIQRTIVDPRNTDS